MRKKRAYYGCEMESPIYRQIVKEMNNKINKKVDEKLLSLKTMDERFKYVQQQKEDAYKTKRGKRSSL